MEAEGRGRTRRPGLRPLLFRAGRAGGAGIRSVEQLDYNCRVASKYLT